MRLVTDQPLSFRERRRQLLISQGKELPPELREEGDPTQLKTFNEQIAGFEEFIPEAEYERTDADQMIDDTIERIELLDAYQKYIGKEINWNEDHLVEGMHFSCPMPNHRDSNPSAWINKTKKTWFCGVCEIGGDVMDLAAIAKGYPIPGYKDGIEFVRLRESVAADYGVRMKRTPGGQLMAWTEDQQPPPVPSNPEPPVAPEPVQAASEPAPVQPEPAPVPEVVTPPSLAVVPATELSEELENEVIQYPTLDWRRIVPKDTFLGEYMEATSTDDSPEEYHFWHGMLALGHAVGHHVYLSDTPVVRPNLLVCLLGGTGFGKSKSRRYLNDLLDQVLHFDVSVPTGVKQVSVPGSGEYLVHAFQHIGSDPVTNKPMPTQSSINGIVNISEMEGLLNLINRQGSSLKRIIFDLADCEPRVTAASMTHGDKVAFKPFCSILTTTQPRAIRGKLDKVDQASGFLNRWIFAGGTRKEREIFGGDHSAIRVDLARAVDQLKMIKAWGARDRKILVAGDVLTYGKEYFERHITPMMDADETELLKRLDLIFKKLMLLFAINNRHDMVDRADFDAAAEVIKYIVASYALLDTQIGYRESDQVATDIQEAIVKHYVKTGNGASPRDINRILHRKKYSMEQIKRALESLEKLDYIEPVTVQTGRGRPTMRYKMVDGS